MSSDLQQKIEFVNKMIDCSQISISDMSELTSISRNTFYRWANGKPASDRIRVNAAYMTAQRLEQAIKNRRLPLMSRIQDKKERLSTLKRIIRESIPQAS